MSILRNLFCSQSSLSQSDAIDIVRQCTINPYNTNPATQDHRTDDEAIRDFAKLIAAFNTAVAVFDSSTWLDHFKKHKSVCTTIEPNSSQDPDVKNAYKQQLVSRFYKQVDYLNNNFAQIAGSNAPSASLQNLEGCTGIVCYFTVGYFTSKNCIAEIYGAAALGIDALYLEAENLQDDNHPYYKHQKEVTRWADVLKILSDKERNIFYQTLKQKCGNSNDAIKLAEDLNNYIRALGNSSSSPSGPLIMGNSRKARKIFNDWHIRIHPPVLYVGNNQSCITIRNKFSGTFHVNKLVLKQANSAPTTKVWPIFCTGEPSTWTAQLFKCLGIIICIDPNISIGCNLCTFLSTNRSTLGSVSDTTNATYMIAIDINSHDSTDQINTFVRRCIQNRINRSFQIAVNQIL
jgi:hypothetical protein